MDKKVYVVKVDTGHASNIGVSSTPELAAKKVEEIVGHSLQWASDWRLLTELPGVAYLKIEEWEIDGSWFTELIPSAIQRAQELEESILKNPVLRWVYGKD